MELKKAFCGITVAASLLIALQPTANAAPFLANDGHGANQITDARFDGRGGDRDHGGRFGGRGRADMHGRMDHRGGGFRR